MINRFWKTNISFENINNSDIQNIKDILFERDGIGNRNGFLRKIYYYCKPLIPRFLQIYLRQLKAKNVDDNGYEGIEQIYKETFKKELRKLGKKSYFIWFWPKGYKMASIITHDVETAEGFKNVLRLADIDEKYGFRSSFEFVPEKYNIDFKILDELKDRGFEVAIHGLNHDGKLFNSEKVFKERLSKIKLYVDKWGIGGFRSPSLLRNALWMQNFDFLWDSSFPDWDPYGPRPGGSKTIFPFFISPKTVELPVTMVQDHTLFEILGKNDISVWKDKIKYIEILNGLINIIIHPDYIFKYNRIEYYSQYLNFLQSKENIWHSLPMDLADWWKRRDKSEIRFDKNEQPYIEGSAAKDGVIAEAILDAGNLFLHIVKHNTAYESLHNS
jgi:peptidoglycan/xylan/chitin deacetylase (PgdA/CDA1 family)